MSETAIKAAEILNGGAASEWEIFYQRADRLTVESKNSEIDAMESSSSGGIGIRVRVNGRPGFSYSSDLSDEALKKVVDAAIDGAKAADVDTSGGFVIEKTELKKLDIWDEKFEKVLFSEKISRAIAVERAALAADSRVSKVRKAAYSESLRSVRIINCNGLDIAARSSVCSASVQVVAEDGKDSQAAWAADHSAKFDGLDFEAVGTLAGRDAADFLGAKPVPTCKMTALFRNSAAVDIIDILGESFSGEAAFKGRSMLAGKIGRKIFGEKITIIDNGLLQGGAATFPFDGEGMPRQMTTAVENGVLQALLYDLAWAKRAGARSTGNAGRSGYADTPRPAKTNFYLKPGNLSFKDMVAGMEDGLIVAELLGAHTANPVTGDFSVGAIGWKVEKGKIAFPVQGITIAGNIIDILKRAEIIGSDLKFMGEVGSPSILVPQMDIGGS